jgi:hypothetical protein
MYDAFIASHSCKFNPEVSKTESPKEVLQLKMSLLTFRLPDFADSYSTVQVSDTTADATNSKS